MLFSSKDRVTVEAVAKRFKRIKILEEQQNELILIFGNSK